MARQDGKRIHIVLIPGFAGFDALGQLEYYAGVTSRFASVRTNNAVLHYFDNFPTAAVITRATRLRSYLAKRIARGEISPEQDEVVLVGHSTGGLDIRWLLWDLHQHGGEWLVDGGVKIEASEILQAVHRVVFLSVPHWGTNIADFVHGQWLLREAMVGELQAAVAGSQFMLLDWIETAIAGSFADVSRAGLFRAMQDALSEANEYNGQPGPIRKADAHEAASQLALYIRHMASDFRAIDDLTCSPFHADKVSPAHFSPDDRAQELRQLRGVDFRSYVTIGRRPFRFEPGQPASAWELTKPWTYPEVTKDRVLSKGTDIVYRTCYRACAGGPFRRPNVSGAISQRMPGAPQRGLELWDNDGIVNTLSMLWPRGDNVLVAADHMDIVGQYKPVRADPGEGRVHRAYDLLNSGKEFGDQMFERIWEDVFTFALGQSRALAAVA